MPTVNSHITDRQTLKQLKYKKNTKQQITTHAAPPQRPNKSRQCLLPFLLGVIKTYFQVASNLLSSA